MAKILVVDDDPILQKLYRMELMDRGHEVVCFSHGREAFQYLHSNHTDLIVLDMIMPGGDGVDFLFKLVSEHLSIPVIIYSAYDYYQKEWITMAADAYLVKSSDLTELHQTISGLLNHVKHEIQKKEQN